MLFKLDQRKSVNTSINRSDGRHAPSLDYRTDIDGDKENIWPQDQGEIMIAPSPSRCCSTSLNRVSSLNRVDYCTMMEPSALCTSAPFKTHRAITLDDSVIKETDHSDSAPTVLGLYYSDFSHPAINGTSQAVSQVRTSSPDSSSNAIHHAWVRISEDQQINIQSEVSNECEQQLEGCDSIEADLKRLINAIEALPTTNERSGDLDQVPFAPRGPRGFEKCRNNVPTFPKKPLFHHTISPLADVTEAYTSHHTGWRLPVQTSYPALSHQSCSQDSNHSNSVDLNYSQFMTTESRNFEITLMEINCKHQNLERRCKRRSGSASKKIFSSVRTPLPATRGLFRI